MPNYMNLSGAVNGFANGLDIGLDRADRRAQRQAQTRNYAQQQANAQARLDMEQQQNQSLTDYRNNAMDYRDRELAQRQPEYDERTANLKQQNQTNQNKSQENSARLIYTVAQTDPVAATKIAQQFNPDVKSVQLNKDTHGLVLTHVSGQQEEVPFYAEDPKTGQPFGIAVDAGYMDKWQAQKAKAAAKAPKFGPGDTVDARNDFNKYYNADPKSAANPNGMTAKDYAGLADMQARGMSYFDIAKSLDRPPRLSVDAHDPKSLQNAPFVKQYQNAVDAQGKKAYTGRMLGLAEGAAQQQLSQDQSGLDQAHAKMKQGLSDLANEAATHRLDMQSKTYKGITPAGKGKQEQPGNAAEQDTDQTDVPDNQYESELDQQAQSDQQGISGQGPQPASQPMPYPSGQAPSGQGLQGTVANAVQQSAANLPPSPPPPPPQKPIDPNHAAYNFIAAALQSGKNPKTGQPLTPAETMLAKKKLKSLEGQLTGQE